jgi:pyruvate,water dikinase
MAKKWVIFFNKISSQDLLLVGGKNASLGEMIQHLSTLGIDVPLGYATTSDAFYAFIKKNKLKKPIQKILKLYHKKKLPLGQASKQIRSLIEKAPFAKTLEKQILSAYLKLSKQYKTHNVDVAVRSSATAEDLPHASFAGQHESFLHIQGKKELIHAVKKCFSSLFTERAIVYRDNNHIEHTKVALCVGIQKMVRSDKASSGVLFTLDTESGFPHVITINASYGLGENVVQGTVIPDEYQVFKPLLKDKKKVPILEKTCGAKEKKLIYQGKRLKNITTSLKEINRFVLTDQEILKLAHWGQLIENHYKHPMDIEWAKDGLSHKLYIVQARFETKHTKLTQEIYTSYTLKGKGKKLLSGLAIGESIASGKVQILKNIKEKGKFKKGSILVTSMTSPDWVPIMKIASGIICDHGGRTSHAAIVSRELGIPALVGTKKGTLVLKEDEEITLSCAEGEIGYIYKGLIPFEKKSLKLENLPKISTPLMINIASPEAAFRTYNLPCSGIGLARMEFIINNKIQIHPMALIHLDQVQDVKEKKLIQKLTQNYLNKEDYFVDLLSKSIAKIASSQYPKPVIVRMSDFKTNEYAALVGGRFFEPKEENPMLGLRGASRYYNPLYEEAFILECKAIRKARNIIGLDNIIPMIPFCRTVEEADHVLIVMKKCHLQRKKEGLQIYMMCEIPSNVLLADEFLNRFDGYSIGSNDLTQLTLGIDRDQEALAPLFDERNPSVKTLIKQAIQIAHKKKKKIGICGQAPSDYIDFAQFLIDEGIDSISLNPDSLIETIQKLAKFKKRKR